MRRIVICFDGTWNQVRQPKKITNVVKFAQAVKPVASDGVSQLAYYNSGVGTGDLVDRVLGGVFGRGTKANVKRALSFLALNFTPGDEIYIFGFSRGAYSARALAGVIGAAGVPLQAEFEQIERIWNYYRTPPKRRQQSLDGLAVKTPIRCVGVWDTVGSYGVPAGFGLAALVRAIPAWTTGFHDTRIGNHIQIGLHALAIDEMRRPFAPTFWTRPKDGMKREDVEQVWFPGVHANIGGSYPDTGISDLALIWMVARLQAYGRDKYEGSTLEFDTAFLARELNPNSAGTLYRSERGWPISTFWPYRRPVLLADGALNVGVLWNGQNKEERHINEKVHWSMIERRGAARYKPRNVTFPPSPEQIADKTPEEAAILAAIAARQGTPAPVQKAAA
jgi:uncharacterized protein (DUF2235 family)